MRRFAAAAFALSLSLPACAPYSLAPSAAPATFANPVLDRDFPDPAVLRAADGFYYAYATQTTLADGVTVNVQVARSPDLVAGAILCGPHLPGVGGGEYRMHRLITMGLIAGSGILAALPAAAQTPAVMPQLAPREVLLEVDAAGCSVNPADSASLPIMVMARGATAAEARAAVDAKVRLVTEVARAAGVAAADIQTVAVPIGPGFIGNEARRCSRSMRSASSAARRPAPPSSSPSAAKA
jgi:hypothetical protein